MARRRYAKEQIITKLREAEVVVAKDIRGLGIAEAAVTAGDARRTLDQRGDPTVASPQEEVAFPVAGHGPIAHLGRALVDAHRIAELALARRVRRPRKSSGICTALTERASLRCAPTTPSMGLTRTPRA